MVPTKDLRVKYVPIGDVRPYEDNPRRNDGAVQAVANSLREFGWKQPIVVDADGADATLIESCALALKQALTTKRRPGRKMRVG